MNCLKVLRELVTRYRIFSLAVVLQIVIVMILMMRPTVVYTLDGTNMSLNTEDYEVTVDDENVITIHGGGYRDAGSRYVATYEGLRIPHGAYEIEARYSVDKYEPYSTENDSDDKICEILINTEKTDGEKVYKDSDISIDARKTEAKSKLWIEPQLGIDDFSIIVNFHGEGIGDLHLSSIVVRHVGKWAAVLAVCLIFVFVDFIYWYFLRENNYKNKTIAALLTAIIVFSSLPLFRNFISGGHDIEFHLTRICELGEGIKNGHWIVPIQTDVWNGYGYVTPLFYNQLFLYIPAVLYCLAVPVYRCYQIYAVIINALTCLIAYLCISKLLKEKYLAILAAMVYTLSAYRLVNVYVRAAVGEYTAMAFLPLVLYGFIKVYTVDADKITWKEYIPIVIGLTGIIGCHTLTCEMAAMFIAAACIILIKKTLEMKRLIALIKAALLTLGINLYFLVPFLVSSQMDLVFKNGTTEPWIQMFGIYLVDVMSIFPLFSEEGNLSLSIGFPLILGMCVFLMCYIKRNQWKTDKKLLNTGIFLTGMAVVSIILSLYAFPWDEIEKISIRLSRILLSMQFPWRYLSMGTVFCVFVTVIGVKLIGKENRYYEYIVIGAVVMFTLINSGFFFGNYVGVGSRNVYYESPNYGDVMYLLEGDDYMVRYGGTSDRSIITDEEFVEVYDYDYEDGITTFNVKNSADTEKIIEIPLFNYDNYHAYDTVNGKELRIVNGIDKRIGVVISPGYEGSVEVRYVIPVLWKISYVLSAITAVGIITGIVFDERKRRKATE